MAHPAWAVLAFVAEFLVKLTMVIVVLLRRRAKPSASIAWILVILSVPLLGIVAYAALGTTRLGSRRIRQHAEINRRVMDAALRTERADTSGVAEVVGQTTAYDSPDATHVGGTCRMGRDPEHSVVDSLGVVHGVPNLTIADASVLVTQGAGDSPSLTIQALALRTAEALASRARRGELPC